MRRLIAFPCAGETLIGTLDAGSGSHGLLIVSGGAEVRAGAHRGMAMLAARLAADGIPVFRYDRRGVGDASGENLGWSGAAPDLAAALDVFRREAAVSRVTGYGNCDAATLLALEGGALGLDAVILSNPWTGDQTDGLPPAAAIRARYAIRMRDPREWLRLVRHGIDVGKAIKGLHKVLRAPRQPLGSGLIGAIAAWGQRATVILAAQDATALAFADAAGDAVEVTIIPTASHSFARGDDGRALEHAIRAAMRRVS